ncbi:MAG: phosphate ABC transporter permease PstA [Anaerolineae bacterium]
MSTQQATRQQSGFLSEAEFERRLARRNVWGRFWQAGFLLAVLFGVAMLGMLLIDIAGESASWVVTRQKVDRRGQVQLELVEDYPLVEGWRQRAEIRAGLDDGETFGLHFWLNPGFARQPASRKPLQAGIWPALVGTLMLMVLVALFAFPIGVMTAIYLEEYAPQNRLTEIIQINIANLAGVPSIVYGMLGLAFFVRAMGSVTNGRSVLSGALTLALLILPVIIINGREAIRAVPLSIRQAAYALGATKSQVVWSHVLPIAMRGVLTGTIIALSRAIGETAPLIMIGALTYIARAPNGITDRFTVMPIQIFNWASLPQQAFRNAAAAGIILLLVVLLSMNASAVYLRYFFERKAR